MREYDTDGHTSLDILPQKTTSSVDLQGGSPRLLAGLVSYGGRGDALAVDDVESVLGSLSSRLLASRTPTAQWSLLLSSRVFSAALIPEAKIALSRQKAFHALDWFDERVIVHDDAVAFGRRVDAEAKRREDLALARLAQRGATLDEAFVQRHRKKLLRSFAWEKSTRALPAVFLLLAAVLAVGMLLRILKLPG